MSWMSWLQVYSLIHNFTCEFACLPAEFVCLTADWFVSCLPMCVFVSLSVDVCTYLCVYIAMYLCVYMCVNHCVCLSVCLSVGCLSLAVGLYVFLSLSQSVYICLSTCLCAFVYLDLSVSLFVCLSVRCWVVNRRSSNFTSVSQSRLVTVRTKRAGNGGEDAERERAGGYAHKSDRLSWCTLSSHQPLL